MLILTLNSKGCPVSKRKSSYNKTVKFEYLASGTQIKFKQEIPYLTPLDEDVLD